MALTIPTRTTTGFHDGSRFNRTSVALWVSQAALTAIFMVAGGSKLVMSAEHMSSQSEIDLPLWFLRFIGVCEFAGALGLILPSVSRIHTGLAPLAACGLVVIMVGATVLTAIAGPAPAALFPFIVGLVAAFVACGRTYLAPIR